MCPPQIWVGPYFPLCYKSTCLEQGKFYLLHFFDFTLSFGKQISHYCKKSSLIFFLKVQVHVEDDPERLYKQTEVSGEKKVTRGMNHVGKERKGE